MYKSALVLAAIVASASAFMPVSRSPPDGALGEESWCARAVVDMQIDVPSGSTFVNGESTPSVSRTVVRAEDADYEKEFAKLQKEAEERLDDKVAELMTNIETVGQK
ncbi:predicted protein [Thalassiosira pseudonana CCMP1335]|uniref:Uncharacterized protein n=1 Tax=Thalassiosira pseudonana TaxID=35128 RepID=B8BZ42_THAPS|nr:predicted protein [Thalassiosira pseudonana CCMP1335]EED93282.1 predicted protein [Thalassiosira pseudonana CCMP1335]